jgi:hypothetical protein
VGLASNYAATPQTLPVDNVYPFATPEDQKVLSNYFKTINESTAGAMFYAHSYETDGFVLQIDGHIPKPVASRYADVFKEVTS